jgi:hypothetical protein
LSSLLILQLPGIQLLLKTIMIMELAEEFHMAAGTTLLAVALVVAALAACPGVPVLPIGQQQKEEEIPRQEKVSMGALGVAVLDHQSRSINRISSAAIHASTE